MLFPKLWVTELQLLRGASRIQHSPLVIVAKTFCQPLPPGCCVQIYNPHVDDSKEILNLYIYSHP
eukprot:3090462-Rhodomonas_salina.3